MRKLMLVVVMVAIVTSGGCGRISFSRDRELMQATSLRFISASEIEFQLCEYSLAEARRNRGKIRCRQPPHPKRLRIPTPLVPGEPG